MRWWILREVLPVSEYENFYLTLQELGGLDVSDGSQDISELSLTAFAQVLSRWVRQQEWGILVQAIECIVQLALQSGHQQVLEQLSATWPEDLSLSPQGFLVFRGTLVSVLLSAVGAVGAVGSSGAVESSEGPEPVVEVMEQDIMSEAQTEKKRRVIYQRIRQRRLKLLEQWESL